ncbi:MAG: hypothetical protein KAI08_01810 [Bacteroidales bacterium]|nr:hypothetical protein [Bacteroidales bacterium]
MTNLKYHFSLLVVLALLLMTSITIGQTHEAAHDEGHEFKRFRAAVNIAHAYMPKATADIDGGTLIIPVWGLDFQFWFNEKWGLALKNDIEIAQYVLTESDDSGEVQLRENPLIISLPLYYSPWEGGLTFFTGPGIELEEDHNFWVYRFGLGYEFELPGHWDFAPEFVYDLKNGNINSFTIAIGVGKRF